MVLNPSLFLRPTTTLEKKKKPENKQANKQTNKQTENSPPPSTPRLIRVNALLVGTKRLFQFYCLLNSQASLHT